MQTLRRARRQDAGFTFVEILVVIIILSVLSLIAIATFFGQREKAERSRALSSLRNAETFAVAIRSDAENYSECVADYNREAGANAPYTWKADDSATADGSDPSEVSRDANEISVYGPSTTVPCETIDGSWVSMAALANEQCFYNLLVPGSDSRLRHRADAQVSGGATYCEASEIQPGSADGKISFRGGGDADPSGW